MKGLNLDGKLTFTSVDGYSMEFRYSTLYGVYATWGLNTNFKKMTRREFVKRWKNHLPTHGIINNSTIEPSNTRKYAIALDMVKAEFDALADDGSQVVFTKINKSQHCITRISKIDDDVISEKTNVITFDSDYDGDKYPYRFSNPKTDHDVISFLNSSYDYLREHISIDEVRNAATSYIDVHCFGALATLKGGIYFVDNKYLNNIKELKKVLDSVLPNGLTLIPAFRTIEERAHLAPIVTTHLEKYWSITTKNIHMTINTSKRISNSTIGKYLEIINETLNSMNYFRNRYGLNLDNIYEYANKLIMQLENKLAKNLSR